MKSVYGSTDKAIPVQQSDYYDQSVVSPKNILAKSFAILLTAFSSIYYDRYRTNYKLKVNFMHKNN